MSVGVVRDDPETVRECEYVEGLQVRMSFERGTLRIDSVSDDVGACMVGIPHVRFDERSKTARAYAMHYAEIVRYLDQSGIVCDDAVPRYMAMPHVQCLMNLRDYQSDAVGRWRAAGMRGCVILPTGSGKTVVGTRAICDAALPALVVVPTIDLMDQWVSFLERNIGVTGYDQKNNDGSSDAAGIFRVGRLGGGSDDIRPITVSTYDSAYIRAPEIGNMFGTILFDEVHHLPAPGYASIAEHCIAPCRLGLTATFEREDGLHSGIPLLTGGVVYKRGSGELAKRRHLAQYEVRRIRVSLSDAEHAEYARCRSDFVAGLNGLGMRSESMYNLKRLIMMSNKNPRARAALLARNRANEIAFNADAKMAELQKILDANCHCDDDNDESPPKKTLVFTQNNKMAYRISDLFLIPIITHKTSKSERALVLDGFRSGRYVAVVTSRVLDEGIDVPDAQIGVIVSGTGSGREMIQRLGRLLRPKHDGAKALLIEMVSDATRETKSSSRRGAALRRSAKSTRGRASAAGYDNDDDGGGVQPRGKKIRAEDAQK